MAYLRQARIGESWWVAVLWLAVSLVTATQVVVGMVAMGMQHDWVAVFLTTVAAWLVFPLATPLILALSHNYPLARAEEWRNLPVHLAGALAIGFAHIAWSATLE